MKQQYKSALAILLGSTLLMTACSASNTGNTGQSGKSVAPETACKGSKIAYITPGMNIPFWRSLSAGIKRGAKEAGATVTDYDSKLSNSTQLQNAQDAITAGVSAIIISPTDSSSAPAVLAATKKANIPVVIADIGTDSGDYVSFIKTDNIGGAKKASDYMISRLKTKGITSGNVGIIGISQTRQNGKDRTKGFSDPVTAAGFSIIPLLESKDYTRSEGLKLAQDLITANPDMVGLFTEHDEASQGALTAMDTSGVGDKLLLVGFDGSPDTFKAIKDGRMGGAAMQQPVLMGKEAFTAACNFLDGKTPEKTVLVDTIMVTQDNVNEKEAEVADNVFAEK